jgi:hypothetical protein
LYIHHFKDIFACVHDELSHTLHPLFTEMFVQDSKRYMVFDTVRDITRSLELPSYLVEVWFGTEVQCVCIHQKHDQ